MMMDDERTATARAQALRLGSAFSPGAPINQSTLFAGRQAELESISDAVVQRGLHVVVFGERGVGKTSLTNVLPEFMDQAGIGDFTVGRVNCDSGDTFRTLWHKVLREVTVSIAVPSAGLRASPQEHLLTLNETLGADPGQEDIRYLLQRVGQRLILVFDEFDRIRQPTAGREMANVIKSLSDHLVDVTVVLVGVADTVDDLVREHQSIDRCLVQVRMPRMSGGELEDILGRGYAHVGMTVLPDAALLIAYLSQGLPHFTHLLGLAAGRAAIEQRAREVDATHVVAAVRAAVHQTQHSIASDYTRATSTQRQNSLFRQVFLACALAETDPLGFFGAADVRAPLSAIMGKRYEIPSFARHLDQFCQAARGPALQRSGAPRHYRYRFVNPLLQPYVVLRALEQGLVTLEQLQRLSS